MVRTVLLMLGALAAFAAPAVGAKPAATQPALGVPVGYRLPADGPLPRTYLVTLAIVDAKNPNWIVSQFAAGVARTVTAENKGEFTETWNGLDDNHMPVPPGDYAVKGIYSPAEKWAVDGEFHAITPRFHSGASSWMPSPEDATKGEPFGGDPTNAPFEDVAVGPNGLAVFYYQYLENGTNTPIFDLNRPVGYGQFVRAFPSGGAGGGTATCTDGETVWSFSTDGGRKYVYRADQKPFGTGGSKDGANRNGVYLPDGWVTAMAAYKSPAGPSVVYVAQSGKIVDQGKKHWIESGTEAVDKITVHAGANGKVLAEIPMKRPRGLAVSGRTLFALHETDAGGFAIASVGLDREGLPGGAFKDAWQVRKDLKPYDLEVDSRGLIYLSDSASNHVFQFDPAGNPLKTFGRGDGQQPGAFDPQTLMSPGKLATWTDKEGKDRLLIVDRDGPNRVTEWFADGTFIRDFLTLQTKANDGYAVDADHPEQIYVPGQRGWLTKFKVDYAKAVWTIDAVYPDVGDDPKAPGLIKPVFVRRDGRSYLCGSPSGRGNCFTIYRLDGDRWKLSAAITRRAGEKGMPATFLAFHDADGNGKADDAEWKSIQCPAGLFNYHGQNWSTDFSLLCINQGSDDVWKMSPDSFDAHGNPVFTKFDKVLADPIFAARAAGKADAVHGGNELAEKYTSDWMQADGSPEDGYYVQARGGKNFSANEGAQHKISRYIPDGKGGFQLKWRTGRTAIEGLAQPGEMYGAMRIRRPINGLLSIVDQSRCGVLLYTEDGLYVDTLFPDSRKLNHKQIGLYSLPGEFFAGVIYPNPADGKIYIGVGKYTPLLYEVQGWSTQLNPVRPIAGLPKTVTLTAAQTATPPEIALSLRGGAGTARLARFTPALGGAVTDGSMTGWESAEPVKFAADRDQTVEVRCLYDPEHLYMRWHARLAAKFDAKALTPVERVFSHDRLADTLSFYVQGDPAAKPNGPPEGRPGDVRFVFGVFKDGDKIRPAAIGMYPKWASNGKPSPQTYQTPVGRAVFEHVGEVAGAAVTHTIDADGKGFVIVATIPRGAIPGAAPFAGGYRTTGNFSATFGGHNAFWWANSDGSASRETYDEPTEARLYPNAWAPIVFQGLDTGVVVRNWLVCGPFGGPGAEKFRADPNGIMPGTNKDWKLAVKEFSEAAKYPPDEGPVDMKAVFSGPMVQGYWPDPKKVQWKPASVEELDTRVVLGPSGQVWYGATWIYSPKEASVDLQLQAHPATFWRWTLNGESLLKGEIKPATKEQDRRPVASKQAKLKAGWNEVRFRAYCVGYPPFRAGLVIAAPQETLWALRLSATPAQNP